ncbi:MAG: acyl-CoA dehydrogenase family protein [Opitutaceae bacterium]|nr:acyl-CoA dehydrogenase family protein [Opitutaceae bacterium]
MKTSDLMEPAGPKKAAASPESTARVPTRSAPAVVMPVGADASRGSPATPPPERDLEPASVIDTSKMNREQREALELTEAARATTNYRSFAGDLFMGRFALDHVYPFPMQPPLDIEAGRPFLTELARVLKEEVDPDQIDADGEVPDKVINRLAQMGAFGIKVPKEYGGLGLSQVNYSRAAMLLGSVDANLTALLSAHQSIGVPQPVKLFGTEEQKKKYLPRVARGEISAFALTEATVGSDPAKMATRAEPTADGRHFIINGEKLWCTNGTRAGVIVVMARTPDKVSASGQAKSQITAFIVEMNTPGVEVVSRCHFMGLRALYNGVIRFTNVKVTREAIVGGEGRGLKVALTTLNTGRLTIPAACVGLMKRCLGYAREWAASRVQWGAPVGRHAAIADKIARIAANTFACEAMALLTSALVDRDKADIRLEAAMAKMWGTEAAWRAVDETMQIRGGRGYETAQSLKSRGEEPVPIERMMRDARINLIFEGSSEIMRLFLAREALDPHLKVAGAALDSRLPAGKRLGAAAKAFRFYVTWYPGLLLPLDWLGALSWSKRPRGGVPAELTPAFKPALAYVAKTSRRLARALFHAMAKHGPKLERQQLTLGRIVDIGTELFAISAAALYADAWVKRHDPQHPRAELEQLVQCFFADARSRIAASFAGLTHNNDARNYKLTQSLLDGKHPYLRTGIVE